MGRVVAVVADFLKTCNPMNERDFESVGIDLGRNSSGRIRMVCPFCNDSRQHHRNEKCLSVDIDHGLYHCYHCGKSGYVPTDDEVEKREQWQKTREEKLRMRAPKGCYHRPSK